MAASTRRRTEPASSSTPEDRPEIARCESCPDRSVFIESGNTDGWIASDLTVEIRQ